MKKNNILYFVDSILGQQLLFRSKFSALDHFAKNQKKFSHWIYIYIFYTIIYVYKSGILIQQRDISTTLLRT